MTQPPVRPPLPDDAFAGASRPDGELRPALSYFGEPMLKKPHWEWNVVSYLFLGGIMGASGLLAALANRSSHPGDAALERSSRYLSLSLAVACPAVLISHLGRPERFTHMLRIVKFKSPMSMGVWGLVAFSSVAAANAAAQMARDGLLPRWGAWFELPRVSIALQAALGCFIAGYTGVLLSATAIPIWAKGKIHVPAMSVCSAVSGACAANALLLARHPDSARTIHKLERLESLAAAAELAILLHFRRFAGDYGKPMFEGERGKRFAAYTLIAGIAAPLALNAPALFTREHSARKPNLFKTLLAGALTLAGGYVLRETLIEAGKDSSQDPKVAFRQPE